MFRIIVLPLPNTAAQAGLHHTETWNFIQRGRDFSYKLQMNQQTTDFKKLNKISFAQW